MKAGSFETLALLFTVRECSRQRLPAQVTVYVKKRQFLGTYIFASHHTDAGKHAFFAGDNFEPVRITALISRVQHESSNAIQPGAGKELRINVGRTAGRYATTTFDAAIIFVDGRSGVVIHALLNCIGIEWQTLMNPGLGALDHAAKPASCVDGQVAYQLEDRQRVQVDAFGEIGRQRATR